MTVKSAGVLRFMVEHPATTAGGALLGTATVHGTMKAQHQSKDVLKQMEAMREDPGTPVAKFAAAWNTRVQQQAAAYEKDAPLLAKAAAAGFGGPGVMGSILSGLSSGVVGTLADKLFSKPINKAFDIIDKKFYLEPKQKNVLTQVIQTDPILSQAMESNPAMVMEAYKTIKQFAPTLTVDVNSLRNFLRQAVTMGGQVDFMTVKLLAEIEKTNRQARGEIGGKP